MATSRFTGLYLSARTLRVWLAVVGVVGAMAFYRAHAAPGFGGSFGGTAISTGSPLQDNEIGPLMTENQAQEHVALHVGPAVVRVQVTSRTSPGSSGQDNPLSQLLGQFGQMPQRQPNFEQGVGSGVVLSPDGYIVTNNHVVEGATDIQVYFNDKREFPGKVVGTDDLTDLAVVKIDATGLPNLPWGDSSQLKQGDTVFAFGNPFNFSFTMTRGIVSGLGRRSAVDDQRAPGNFIQTDAAINPGNSGGALVDVHGQVVGINSFILSDSGSFSGAGFAIPSEVAEPTVREIIAHGKVVRGYMGIGIEDIDPSEAQFFNLPLTAEGALVSDVTAGAPASKAGMQVGDLITQFNGKKVTDSSGLQIITGQTPPGTRVSVSVLREGKQQSLSLTLGTLPEGDVASAEEAPTAPGRGMRGRRNAPPVATAGPLGITAADITADARSQYEIPDNVKGALVQGVRNGSAAENSGLAPTSPHGAVVISEVNRHPVANADELRQQLQAAGANKDVLLQVWAGGSFSYLLVRPESIGSGSGNGGGPR